MKVIISFIFLLISSSAIYAQDDLLDILDEEAGETTEYTYATFKDTRIIHGQSVELTSPGELQFVIQHRFGKINDGAYNFFGLDQATMRMGLQYGVTSWLNVGIGRSSFKKTFDGYLKAKVLRQSAGKKSMPVSVSVYTSAALNSLRWDDPERTNYFSSRMSYSGQLLIARKWNNSISLQVMPTYVHRNLVATEEDQNDIYAIGVGGRVKVSNRVAITGEYYYQLDGYNATITNNSIALGVDIETGGHVFQFHLTNSKGMIEPYFIAETQGDILNGDIYFGFNISRVFVLKKENRK
ncbi:DUF5777 family beta-barrel protein [Fulvivirga sedimenti]|uniref:DUF5777 family beta-barrel protein n=1 Tax=Fulvivirga sedimenti TaxID=2879465 RepID=A0A9X1HN07_9BACT|nr:DUF5777 family beta-barrel protein [Fulvivirga sedimenti]MCA6073572.1 DUF5777 family beta-barrel protein [Fulvivirga sedimenti]